jgi:FMN phosphatase YigB (HAD superfamily)
MKSKTRQRAARAKTVFLFDVDNTLLDSDRINDDLTQHLRRGVGPKRARCYWAIFEQLRTRLGYSDYLGALQRCRRDYPHDLGLLAVSRFLINYPFANRLFPNALDVIARVKRWGTAVLLTDGDVVFQPRKVDRSGLYEAVDGHALIYVHKELELADVEARYPAEHYVVVDDKLRILAAIKKAWGRRVTTVFVRQGHYARDPKMLASRPPADVSVERIGGLADCQLQKSEPTLPLARIGRAASPLPALPSRPGENRYKLPGLGSKRKAGVNPTLRILTIGHHEPNSPPGSCAHFVCKSPGHHDHLSSRGLTEHSEQALGQTLETTQIKET